MATELKQTTQQRLLLLPKVALALDILRMANMELQTFLQQHLDENPLLELEEDAPEPDNLSPAETDTQEETPPDTADDELFSHWQLANEKERPSTRNGDTPAGNEHRDIKPPSLYDWLRIQLGCQRLTEEQHRLANVILERLDENGYLEGSLQELSTELGAEMDALEDAIKLIQRLDPPGVAARDLRECLMIQLEHQQATNTLAYRIVQDHFRLFAQRSLSAIGKATGTTSEEVAEAYDSLKHLNPKPGRNFTNDLPATVVPDLIIHNREQHFDVELRDDNMPHMRISRIYSQMLKNPDTPADAKEFLTNKFRQASWIIKAIDERNTTLIAIARCLISLQRDFLERGTHALKPLTQAQVAELIGRHPSTVSRAISGKTIDTPYGVFRLEQFFASNIPQNGQENGNVSDETIKSQIRQLVDQEDAKRPFSDSELTKRLAEHDISVARRTIAKYRTSLKILPAHLRKHRL